MAYDTKYIQELLNDHGYNLAMDGIHGPLTERAVKDFQKANGLTVDGKVGPQTMAALTAKPSNTTKTSKPSYTYNGTPTTKPTIEAAPTVPTFNTTATPLPTTNTTSWDDTAKGNAALGAMNSAMDAYNNYGDFTFSQQGWLNEVLDSIKNYGDFSYDLNGDALYQQYKDKYIQQGKLAMGDAMGQAAAMTGGYGSSYAQSVGQQAYQAQLQNLNDIVPELYQMALDQYNTGKQDLYNQYGLISSERQNEYGMHQDGYNKLLDALGIAQDNYYRGGDMYHTEQNMQNAELWNQYNASEEARQYINSLLQQGFENDFNVWDANNTNAWKSAEWDEAMRQYGNDEYWKDKEYDLDERQVSLSEQAYADQKAAANETNNKQPSNHPQANKPQQENNKTSGFTGSTYSEAVAYAKAKGVPEAYASGIMTASEWSRRKNSSQSTGKGGEEVKNYSTYKDYLADITEYLVEIYG